MTEFLLRTNNGKSKSKTASDMSFLFMAAGYFVPVSDDVKGAFKFIKDRLFRLGIPLVIFMLIIHSITVKTAYPEIDFIGFYTDAIKALSIFSATGPLWLIIFLHRLSEEFIS